MVNYRRFGAFQKGEDLRYILAEA